MTTTHTNKISDPLIVTLDNVLLKNSILDEVILQLVRKNPFIIFKLLFLLILGKLSLRSYINKTTKLNFSLLPYNKEVLDYIKKEKEKGRKILLITDNMPVIANGVANHLGIFEKILCTFKNDFTKSNQADLLQKQYGCNFIYMGNNLTDNRIWDIATKAIVVAKDKNILKNQSKLIKHIFVHKNSIKSIWNALKPLHWVKNILVFLPSSINFEIFILNLWYNNLLTFFSLCLAASAVYLFNDITDIYSDRSNSERKNRAIAAGNLSIVYVIPILAILVILSSALALTISTEVFVIILIYFISNIFYSLLLKNIIMIDVICLAALHLLRIIAGNFASGLLISPFLITATGLTFLGLALLKRYGELSMLSSQKIIKVPGRRYTTDMINPIFFTGVAAHIGAIITFIFYLQTPSNQSLYQNTKILPFLPIPLILIFAYIWYQAKNHNIKEDPVLYTCKNKTILLLFSILLILFLIGKFDS